MNVKILLVCPDCGTAQLAAKGVAILLFTAAGSTERVTLVTHGQILKKPDLKRLLEELKQNMKRSEEQH